MGLSASQARLLSITARLSDNELHSQQIANAKVRLADQTQEASREYVNSLDAQKLVYTMYDAKGNSTQVNFTPAIMYEYAEMKNQYGISNNSGQLLISAKDALNFENSANIDEFLKHYLNTQQIINPEYTEAQNEINNQLQQKSTLNNQRNILKSSIDDIENNKDAKIAEKASCVEERDRLKEQLAGLNKPNIYDYQNIEYTKTGSVAQNLLNKVWQTDTRKRIPDFINDETIDMESADLWTNVRKSDFSILVDFLGVDTFTTSEGNTFTTQYYQDGGIQFSNSTQSFELKDGSYAPNECYEWKNSRNITEDYFNIAQILKQPENAQLKQDIIDFTYERCENFSYDLDAYEAIDDDSEHELHDCLNWEETVGNDLDAYNLVVEFHSLLRRVQAACEPVFDEDSMTGVVLDIIKLPESFKSRDIDNAQYDATEIKDLKRYDMYVSLSNMLPAGSYTAKINDQEIPFTLDDKGEGYWSQHEDEETPGLYKGYSTSLYADNTGSFLVTPYTSDSNNFSENFWNDANTELKQEVINLVYQLGEHFQVKSFDQYSDTDNTTCITSNKDETFGSYWDTDDSEQAEQDIADFNAVAKLCKKIYEESQYILDVSWVWKNDGEYDGEQEYNRDFSIYSKREMFLKRQISVQERYIKNIESYLSGLQDQTSQLEDIDNAISEIDGRIDILTSKLPSHYNDLVNQAQFQWYINLWHRINGMSEEKSPEGINGKYYKILEDNLYKSSTWLQFALEQGLVTLEQVQFVDPAETEKGLANSKWQSKIYTTCTDIQFIDDETAVARAEAIYTRKLNEIEAKDKKYDNDIKKLDTEHNALQTEYESVKSVVDKNIERSFKAFS